MYRECKKHGLTNHFERTDASGFRCMKCRAEQIGQRRRMLKQKLVDHFGGECIRCGYKKCIGALCFHHRDPSEKAFVLNQRQFGKSFESLLKEARKCDLLCANCHAEVHEERSNETL
jgi:aromatic ring hydroxylase